METSYSSNDKSIDPRILSVPNKKLNINYKLDSRSPFNMQDFMSAASSNQPQTTILSPYIQSQSSLSSSQHKYPNVHITRSKFSSPYKKKFASVKKLQSRRTTKRKPEISSKCTSCFTGNFSNLFMDRSQFAAGRKLSPLSEISKIQKAKLQAELSSSHFESSRLSAAHFHVFKKSSNASCQTLAWKNIIQKMIFCNEESNIGYVLVDPDIMIVRESIASKTAKCCLQNSSDIQKLEEYKMQKNDTNEIICFKYVIKEPQSSYTSIPFESIEPNLSIIENLIYMNSKKHAGIKTLFDCNFDFKSHKLASKSLLNINSKNSHRKRIIYDESKEKERLEIIQLIEKKQQLLKYRMIKGKYSENKKTYARYCDLTQLEIDGLFDRLDRLDKMPNYPDKKRLVQHKEKNIENITSLNVLLRLLLGEIETDVNIENVHEYIDYGAFKGAFDHLQNDNKKLLTKMETMKLQIDKNVENFNTFLKLNPENVSSGANINLNGEDNIFGLCDKLRKDLDNNLNGLLKLKTLVSDMASSVPNYINLEKKFCSNSFNFGDNKRFYSSKAIR